MDRHLQALDFVESPRRVVSPYTTRSLMAAHTAA